MRIKIPSNQIVFNYTVGGEYMFASTFKEYQGHYYKVGDKVFAGEEFSPYAPELIKMQLKSNKGISKFNPLLANAATYIYGKISKTKINDSTFSSVPFNKNNNLLDKGGQTILSFYCKKINSNIIKKIEEDIYIELQKNPIYQTTFIGEYNGIFQTVEQADQQVPGVKAFLAA